jgi:hypothetical protein
MTPKFFKAIQSAYGCEWVCDRQSLDEEGHPIAFENKKLVKA